MLISVISLPLIAQNIIYSNLKELLTQHGDTDVYKRQSFNNIIVSLANSEGQIISWSSAGKMGFRGSKKNSPYAAQMAAQDCAKNAFDLGLRKVKAYVQGPGHGRESAIRTIHGAGIEVTEIIDVTPLPHNGCRWRQPQAHRPPALVWRAVRWLLLPPPKTGRYRLYGLPPS